MNIEKLSKSSDSEVFCLFTQRNLSVLNTALQITWGDDKIHPILPRTKLFDTNFKWFFWKMRSQILITFLSLNVFINVASIRGFDRGPRGCGVSTRLSRARRRRPIFRRVSGFRTGSSRLHFWTSAVWCLRFSGSRSGWRLHLSRRRSGWQ